MASNGKLGDSLHLPHPLHIFSSLTSSRHYHFGYFANGSSPGLDAGFLAQAMDRLSLRCLDWLPRSSAVLDVGCGIGGTLAILADRGHEAVGVDVCERSIASARSALEEPRVRLHACDFLELSAHLLEERFDALILIETVHRLHSLQDVFATAQGFLRPGGFLVAQDVVLNEGNASFAAPFHARGSLARIAAAEGFVVLHQEYLTTQVFPTLQLLLGLLDAERQELVLHFRDQRPGIEREIDELRAQLEHLVRAFAAGHLAYEEVVVQRKPGSAP